MSLSAVARAEQTGLLRDAVAHAILAPSSHNTQPWLFHVDDDRLELYADRTRALPFNDPRDRELTISCGAALLNARLAAAHAGAGLEVVTLPDGDDPDLLARARVVTDGTADVSLFAAVPQRRTYRGNFADRPVPADVRESLARAAAAEGAQLHIVGEAERRPLATLVAEGDRIQFADPRWRGELASWMHPRRRREGLVVGALAAPATRFVVGHFDVGKRIAGKDAELARRSPLLAVLTTDGDTAADWLAAGQALQRVLLTATAAGLQASHLNQPIQVESLRPRVAALLRDASVPQVILRLGYPPDDAPAAPRRPVEAVLAP